MPPGVIGAPPSPFHPEFAAPAAVGGDVATSSATVTNTAGVDVTNQVASYAWEVFGGRRHGQRPQRGPHL